MAERINFGSVQFCFLSVDFSLIKKGHKELEEEFTWTIDTHPTVRFLKVEAT